METIKLKDKCLMVSYEKELLDSKRLIERIKQSGWVSSDLVIVNCFPEYSARITQLMNHGLSYLNNNELFEQIDLQMPYPNMNQVWNQCDKTYQNFSKYLSDWVRLNVGHDNKYLFLSAAENLSQIRSFVKHKLEPDDYRLASVYVEQGYTPDFYIENYPGKLLFQWENMDNPNWNY